MRSPSLSEKIKKQEKARLYRRVAIGVVGAGAVLIVALFFIVPPIFANLSDSTNQEAAVAAVIATSTPTNPSAYKHLSLIGKSAIVYDLSTGKVLYAQNAYAQLPLASITKLLTLYAASSILQPSSPVSMTPLSLSQAGDAADNGFTPGETFNFEDLARLTLAASSNDGAEAIAEAADTAGNTTTTDLLSHAASQLGLSQTYAVNSSGLDVNATQSGGYGSAHDIAVLAGALIQKAPQIAQATTLTSISVTSQQGVRHAFANTDIDVDTFPNLLLSKTGETDLAGGNLVIVYDTGINHPIAIVVLGSTQNGRFTDMQQLMRATLAYFGEQPQTPPLKTSMGLLNAARVLTPFVISFAVGLLLAPLLTHYLYKYKAWKKQGGKGKGIGDDNGTPLFDELHKVREVSTPRMGGILVWSSVIVTTFGLAFLGFLFDGSFGLLNFINRGQTWLPLTALIVGGFVGLIDDVLEVTRSRGGLSLRWRLLVVALFACFAGWWFYYKLAVTTIGIPFLGVLHLGPFFIPFFVLVTLALYASGVIDGIDGLAGGVFAIIFMIYAGIAFAQNQIALAGFAATVSGAVFSFLWFNIPPARFYLSETGSMALTLALAVTAFSTDTLGGGVGVAVLPIIALPLTMTVVTNLLQVFWKKVFKKKLFRIAPIHHHFETMGWPPYKVTMRYWIITIMAGIFGLALALLK